MSDKKFNCLILPIISALTLLLASGIVSSQAANAAPNVGKAKVASGTTTNRQPVLGLRGAKAAAASVLAADGQPVRGKRFTAFRRNNRVIKVQERQDDGYVATCTFKRTWLGLGKSFELTHYQAKQPTTGRAMPALAGGELRHAIGNPRGGKFRQMKVEGGVHLDDAIVKAAQLSRRLGRAVIFTHNRTSYTVPANASDGVKIADLLTASTDNEF
ncbi:MAG: hypothetical protein IPL79_16260 [Myxococcales bacterium]|nr:hypothetical protein [Myxococcales bacterium]